MTLDEYFTNLDNKSGASKEKIYLIKELVKQIKLNPDLLIKISNKLGLLLNNKQEMNENSSPVCFANSPEVREEFKTEYTSSTISQIDLFHYYYKILDSSKSLNHSLISLSDLKFPDSKEDFFDVSKRGKELLELQLS